MSDSLKAVIGSLTELTHTVKTSSDTKIVEVAIKSTRDLARKIKQGVSNGEAQLIDQLDTELSTWQSKLEVIFKEPIGRQGMAKHSQHWAERLTSLSK